MRGVVLNDIFPTPERVIAPEDIVDFKRDHRKELNRFRDKIEPFLIRTAAIHDDRTRSDLVDLFRNEVRGEIQTLKEGMKERNWGYISWGRFLAYAPGLVALMAPNPLTTVGGILSLANAVYRDYMHIRGDDLLQGNPMAYAMLVEEMGGRQ